MKIATEMVREASDPDKVDPWRNGFWVLTQEELERFADLVRADEREACAKVCDEEAQRKEDEGTWLWEARRCAEAIRARSNT